MGEDVVDKVISYLDLWGFWPTGPMLPLQLECSEGKNMIRCCGWFMVGRLRLILNSVAPDIKQA